MKNDKYKGHLAALSANIIFGLNVPVSKAVLSGWMTPLGFTLSRMLFGAAVFWLIGFFAKKESVPVKDMLIIAAGGFFGLVVTQFAFALGLEYTTPVNFSLIVALSPVVVMLLAALLLKEPVSALKTVGVLLGIAGVGLLIFHAERNGAGANNKLGIALAFVNVISYAVYLIITRTVSRKYAPATLMKWTFLFTALMLIPFGWRELPAQPVYSAGAPLSALLELGFIFVFSTCVAYFLVPLALRRIRPTTVSVYMNLQPIIASTVAIFVGQDTFSWDKPLAALLVISGAYVVSLSRSREDMLQEKNS